MNIMNIYDIVDIDSLQFTYCNKNIFNKDKVVSKYHYKKLDKIQERNLDANKS